MVYYNTDDWGILMISGIICYSIIGTVIGVIFSLLYINFDKTWIKIVSSLLSIGGSVGFLVAADNFFVISEQNMKFWTASSLYAMFLLSFCVMMVITCKLIKDKDDADILRIRDILLGQKSYIDKYYKKREAEIESQLPDLELREEEVINKEKELAGKQTYIESELNKLKQLSNKRIKIVLPRDKDIIINKEFVELMPSYIADVAICISNLKRETEELLERDNFNLNNFKSYLILISTYIAQDFFGGKSNDIRIHFRYYNEQSEKYEKLVAIIGAKIVNKNMTPIPYKNSMIQESFECKRAVIKSINSEHDFQSNNYTIWKDYMTYSFYNLKRNEKPFLTFGISVKNEVRFKNLFYFLNYFGLEVYLEEYIDQIDEQFNIEKILYQ